MVVSMSIQALILEDEPADADLMVDELRQAGFQPEWQRVGTKADYLARLAPTLDIILADHKLPQFDALSAFKLMQEQGLDIPFIIVSGVIGEEQAVAAIKLGIDDYVMKDRLRRLGLAVAGALETRSLREKKQQAEQKRRESETRYRMLVEHASDGIFITTHAGQFTHVNSAGCHLLGYSEEELLQKTIEMVTQPAAGQPLRAEEPRPGNVVMHEREMIRKDGTLICVEISESENPDGSRQQIVRDTTERKRHQLERDRLLQLEREQQQLNAELLLQVQSQARQIQQILDTVPEGVVLLDGAMKIVVANPVAREYLSALAPNSTMHRVTVLGGLHIERILHTALTQPWQDVKSETPLPRIFEVAAHPLPAESTDSGWILVLRDVTVAREQEEQLHGQERLATVGQMAAGIAHDFNNILTVISLYSQMLRRNPAMARPDEFLEMIETQTQRAARLVKKILDFGHRSMMQFAPLELAPFMDEIVALLRSTLPDSIALTCAATAEPGFVTADRTHLEKVLLNLGMNACDAMPHGGRLQFDLGKLTIPADRSAPVPGMGDGVWAVLTVTDSGSGIAPEQLPRIFEPFFTTKPVGQGSGLGLAQAYGIVKQHNGEITVESQLGKGTTFRIYLPALAMKAPTPAASELESLPSGNETLLLVEDEGDLRDALQAIFQGLGYTILVAGDGEAAMVEFGRAGGSIDLVLSDVVMPGMSGVDLYHALKEYKPELRMILSTGYPLDEGRELLDQGVVAWMQKPYSTEAIAQKVRSALDAGLEVASGVCSRNG